MAIGVKDALEAAKLARTLKTRGLGDGVAEEVAVQAVKRGYDDPERILKEGPEWFGGQLSGTRSERVAIRDYVRAGRRHNLEASRPATMKKD